MIEIHTLGAPIVSVDGSPVRLPRKQMAVLTYLTLGTRRGLCRRDTLVGLFWPEQSQSAARTSLRQPLSAFRKTFGADFVITRGDDEVGLDHGRLDCDAVAFDAAIASGELDRAIALYQGPFLDGLYLRGCREFDDWVDNERYPRARAFLDAVERRAAEATGAGDLKLAAELLGKLFFNDPASERAVLLLMDCLESMGLRSDARDRANTYVDRCRRDGMEPSQQVLQRLSGLRDDPPVIATPRLPDLGSGATHDEALREALGHRYTLLEHLGDSPSATVWLADDRKLHRHVAIKVMKPGLATNLDDYTRFTREIRFLTRLNHPNVVTLLDSDEADGFLYYVMSHVPGPTLRELIHQNTYLEIGDAVEIVEQLSGALEYAHSHGVLHRDVKPDNILLHEGRALLGDFGVSRALTSAGGERLTSSGQLVGTPEYMCPEQAAGGDADTRGDVYGLACVLYEMLTGEPVFTGATPEIVIRRQVSTEPAPPRIVRPKISVGLEKVILRGLAKDPDERYATPLEFAEAARAHREPASFVFVSYSRSNKRSLSRLVHQLRELEHEVWYDDAIPLASEWDSEIASMIERCTAVVLLLSQTAVDSRHVRREIKFADGQEKPILSVRMEEVELRHGLQMALPPHQMLDARDGQIDAEQLDAALRRLTG